ncbi:MAG TPA: hypothetical protein VHM20_01000 [Gammaproteobacteria bacterium]|jgi:hypothetical protein|nr:hypothetical protein [Gammaproteobacteria bacterium]
MTEKTNWFTGCDTFEKLTEAFKSKRDEILLNKDNSPLDFWLLTQTLMNQYIMILENNFYIEWKL